MAETEDTRPPVSDIYGIAPDYADNHPDSVPAPMVPGECHEEVTRKGHLEPCEKPAVAMRIDPNEGTPYPVCVKHTRADMVPLRAAVDAATPAASVPAANILALAGRWEFQASHPAAHPLQVRSVTECVAQLRSLVADAEQADKGEAADTPRDDEAQTEPLCICGHNEAAHDICHFDHNQCLCGCRVFTPPASVPVNDEAEGEAAWMGWVHDKAINQGDGPERWLFVSGFRAARQEDA